MSKAEEIETASVPLETRLNELLEMAKNKEFYVEETSRYNRKSVIMWHSFRQM